MTENNKAPLKVIITGATGMVGKGVMYECMDHPQVGEILVINRRTLGITHPKLKEIVHQNLFNLSAIESQLAGYDVCFFCLGVSAFRMKEEDYRHITYDLTINFAKTLLRLNPRFMFQYISGQGTDSSEKGSMMWARIKGKTENALLAMPFTAAYMLRPGYIHPLRGIRSRTALYNAAYVVMKPLYPLLKRIIPDSITTTSAVGQAMIRLAIDGYHKQIINPRDINLLSEKGIGQV